MEAVQSLLTGRQKAKVEQKYWNIIKMFNRCEQGKCLPKAGGMESQSERMMTYFDVIRSQYDEYRKREMDREARVREVKSKLKRR